LPLGVKTLQAWYPRYSAEIQRKAFDYQTSKIQPNSRLILSSAESFAMLNQNFIVEFNLPSGSVALTVTAPSTVTLDRVREAAMSGLTHEQRESLPAVFCVLYGAPWVDGRLPLCEFGMAADETCAVCRAFTKTVRVPRGTACVELPLAIPDRMQTLAEFTSLLCDRFGLARPSVCIAPNIPLSSVQDLARPDAALLLVSEAESSVPYPFTRTDCDDDGDVATTHFSVALPSGATVRQAKRVVRGFPWAADYVWQWFGPGNTPLQDDQPLPTDGVTLQAVVQVRVSNRIETLALFGEPRFSTIGSLVIFYSRKLHADDGKIGFQLTNGLVLGVNRELREPAIAKGQPLVLTGVDFVSFEVVDANQTRPVDCPDYYTLEQAVPVRGASRVVYTRNERLIVRRARPRGVESRGRCRVSPDDRDSLVLGARK
jgi:hypothetical protein